METSIEQRQSRRQEKNRDAPDDGGEAKVGQKGSGRTRSLNRAVEVFQLLHAVGKPMPVGEIARRLEAPRSTIYEIVNLFLAADILEYAGNSSAIYFGRAIYLYANDYYATHALVRLGEEEVRRLGALTGETCQLCMPIGNKYTVVAMQNSARLFRIGSDIGTLVPIPSTASGRFFVAHMTLAELNAFIPPEDFQLHNCEAIDPAAFLTEARAAAQAGICVMSGLVDDFATCVAAPVMDHTGRCAACICFVVSRATDAERMRDLSGELLESARKLSAIPDV
ncbi:MAG: IclR family transcriptional regulator [Hyphomicrobiales bacterium]|nr:IclR family transcriptional regulator [Hyphomicrobiales bacterium]